MQDNFVVDMRIIMSTCKKKLLICLIKEINQIEFVESQIIQYCQHMTSNMCDTTY